MNQNEGLVIVVGGAKGIGRVITKTLAKDNFEIVIADTNKLDSKYNQYSSQNVNGFDEAKLLENEIRSNGGKATAYHVNACVPEEVNELIASIEPYTHRLSAVVNCFGITHVSTIESMSLDEFNSIIQGNLQGVFLVSKSVIPILRNNGGGSIVNFASISAKMGFPNVVHYCAAKAAVIGFTNALALEVAQSGIRVNAVCPGIVRTALWEYLLDEFTDQDETREECWERMISMIPQKTAQSAEDIASFVSYLLNCKGINGQAFSLDGGMNKVPWI